MIKPINNQIKILIMIQYKSCGESTVLEFKRQC